MEDGTRIYATFPRFDQHVLSFDLLFVLSKGSTEWCGHLSDPLPVALIQEEGFRREASLSNGFVRALF